MFVTSYLKLTVVLCRVSPILYKNSLEIMYFIHFLCYLFLNIVSIYKFDFLLLILVYLLSDFLVLGLQYINQPICLQVQIKTKTINHLEKLASKQHLLFNVSLKERFLCRRKNTKHTAYNNLCKFYISVTINRMSKNACIADQSSNNSLNFLGTKRRSRFILLNNSEANSHSMMLLPPVGYQNSIAKGIFKCLGVKKTKKTSHFLSFHFELLKSSKS